MNESAIKFPFSCSLCYNCFGTDHSILAYNHFNRRGGIIMKFAITTTKFCNRYLPLRERKKHLKYYEHHPTRPIGELCRWCGASQAFDNRISKSFFYGRKKLTKLTPHRRQT